MERELKIVVRVGLVFFIFGLTQFFTTRAFITPIFLNYLIAGALSIVFYVMNINKEHSYLLLMYAVGLIFFSFGDDMTFSIIQEFIGSDSLDSMLETEWFVIPIFTLFYGSMLWGIVLFYRYKRNLGISLLMSALLIACVSIYPLGWPGIQFFLITSFFILFFIQAQKLQSSEQAVLRVLSSQYLLLILLDGYKYLAFV
ncbi:hypothetical protein JYT72_03005 [Crocinitomix catalasitica]|nr:hypothetical protein [Crocinitomix catalasitica]